MQRMERSMNKFMHSQHGGSSFPMIQATAEIVLTALIHDQKFAAELPEADILREAGKGLTDGGEEAAGVQPDFSPGDFQQILLRDGKPLPGGKASVRCTCFLPQKIGQPKDAVAVSADRGHPGAGETHELLGKLRIGPFQLKSLPTIHHILSGQEKAETGFEIMIPGDAVIIAQHFTAAAAETDGDFFFQNRKILLTLP